MSAVRRLSDDNIVPFGTPHERITRVINRFWNAGYPRFRYSLGSEKGARKAIRDLRSIIGAVAPDPLMDWREDLYALEAMVRQGIPRNNQKKPRQQKKERKPRQPRNRHPRTKTPRLVKSREWALDFYGTFEWRSIRYDVLNEQGRRCRCCGNTPENGAILNVDHIKPVRAFPELKLQKSNLQVLCSECNHGKSNKVPEKSVRKRPVK